uniref:DUF1534 domain-containing protein n=1 Tax=Heterorhabditis bacteriophora TaxID=37862 RepID=A0A1I7XPH4_HETBA
MTLLTCPIRRKSMKDGFACERALSRQ